MGMNTLSGIGAAVDAARAGTRVIDRMFSDAVEQEIRRLPLAQGVGLRDLRQGECCSIHTGGAIGPFDALKPFAGFAVTLTDDGTTKAAVCVRGAVMLRVEGLRAEPVGRAVHALGPNSFGLNGGAEIGQIISIEHVERSLAIVAFKRADDLRPFGEERRPVERF